MVTINNINIFESFSGYGSQHKALKNVYGDIVKSKGIMEIDADAIIAYASIHYREHNLNKLASELLRNSNNDDIARIRAELKAKNVGFNHSKNKSSIDRMAKEKLAKLYLADKISNNYGDISLCNDTVIQDIDIYTYSFPCQDLSVAGHQNGLDGTRSGLLWECEKFIEINKPKILLMENVKNLIGKKFLPDFEKWVSKLETLGYKTVYGVLDAKDFVVPQQRQRVFAISILGDNDFVMPEGEPNPNRIWNILENTSEESLFFSQDIVDKFIEENGEYEELPLTASLRMLGMINIKGNECIRRVYDKNGLCPTLTTMAGGHRQPKVLLVDDDRNYSIRKLSPLECWRLMGMTLEDFIQAESHCSNSQLYQMAGNSIVVNVLEAIFKNLKKYLTN